MCVGVCVCVHIYIYIHTYVYTTESDAAIKKNGISLAVQLVRPHMSTAGGMGSIPGRGTKIPPAVWQGQKKKNEDASYILLWKKS